MRDSDIVSRNFVALGDYARPRDKISDLLNKGIIVRVEKGLYVFGDGRAFLLATPENFKELLGNAINKLNVEQARREVEPFVKNPERGMIAQYDLP